MQGASRGRLTPWFPVLALVRAPAGGRHRAPPRGSVGGSSRRSGERTGGYPGRRQAAVIAGGQFRRGRQNRAKGTTCEIEVVPRGCPRLFRLGGGIAREDVSTAGAVEALRRTVIGRPAILCRLRILLPSERRCTAYPRPRQATSTKGERCRYWRESSTHSTWPNPRSSASERTLESANRSVRSGSASHW